MLKIACPPKPPTAQVSAMLKMHHMTVVRSIEDGSERVVFCSPGLSVRDNYAIIIMDDDSICYGSAEYVDQTYAFVRTVPMSKITLEVPLEKA